MKPLFIVVEGPNGVGKTTTVAAIAARLGIGDPVHTTTEPTDTPLGRLARSQENGLIGRALALAIAADRYIHIAHEITPALRGGTHVVSDRYVPSSLVLQRIDGLSAAEIWEYNRHASAPDLTVYLEDDPDTIGARLAARTTLSRLEKEGGIELELGLYRDARSFLAARGWNQAAIDCRGLPPGQIAGRILRCLPDPFAARSDPA
ncbi:dTMP kinase [Nocardiopsis mangrovi]|uniref:Thymidylate kinase n=1 Tax=Nocardiopsis mangrovi TaxID=1179818 RepID=A0ABV9E1J1_9ACTN